VSNCTSSILPISDGIPQGSNLGPILFLLFINDLPLCLNNSTLDIYAGDATLSSVSKWIKANQISTSLCNDLYNIEQWSHTNKMLINKEKTKAMLVVGKRQRKRHDINQNLNILLNGITLNK
jgi:hypothetical protein